MTMTREELNEKLELHRKWLGNKDGGEQMDLRYADLRGASLRGADLREADLSDADLSKADLSDADLNNADLREANLDYSVLPLWCGSLRMHIDDRIAGQLLYHVASTVLYSKHTSEELKRFCGGEEMLSWANRFHCVGECGKLPRCGTLSGDEKE